MATRNCPEMDLVIKPLDTVPEDKKVRSTFGPFEKPTNQIKRVHSENNAGINFNKSSSAGKESPKFRGIAACPSEWKVGSPEGDQAVGRRYTFYSYQGRRLLRQCQICR
uniref:Uncharacterized protein n=1 Tax=Capra hircus TaxID=9925 RepID=A0A452DVT4_CAPHI